MKNKLACATTTIVVSFTGEAITGSELTVQTPIYAAIIEVYRGCLRSSLGVSVAVPPSSISPIQSDPCFSLSPPIYFRFSQTGLCRRTTAMAPVRTAGAVATLISVAIVSYFLCKTTQQKSSRRKKLQRRRNGLVAAIGNTPLIRINSLSDATGCEILGKAEFLNPGGSVKDRVAVKIIEEVNRSGQN